MMLLKNSYRGNGNNSADRLTVQRFDSTQRQNKEFAELQQQFRNPDML